MWGIDFRSFAVKIGGMAKTGSTDFFYKKAFEISYALFRIAAIVKSRSFGNLLEEKANMLLNSIISEDYQAAISCLRAIDYFMRFGGDIGLIHQNNSEIIIKEARDLNSAIVDFPENSRLPELNFEKLFSKNLVPEKEFIPAKKMNPDRTAGAVSGRGSIQEISAPPRYHNVRQEWRGGLKNTAKSELPEDESEIVGKRLPEIEEINPAKAGIRQSRIIGRIQEIENCRFGELQDFFPEIGERTLRYDLQSLVDRGLVERMGGGRNSSYGVKRAAGTVIELPGAASAVQMQGVS